MQKKGQNEEILQEINYSKYQIDPSIKMRMFDVDGMPLESKARIVEPEEEEGEIIFQLNAGIKPGTKIQKHMDYELWEMTPEQREVYEALQCEEEGAYEDLDDDFVIEANDGKVPMVMRTEHLDEGKLKKVLKEEYEGNEEGNTESGLIDFEQLKAMAKRDIKEFGVKVKGKDIQKEKEKPVKEEKKKLIEYEVDEEMVENMGILEMEAYYKRPNKKYEVLEEKTTKLEGGGLFIFKRVKKIKKPKKKEKTEEIEDEIKETKEEKKFEENKNDIGSDADISDSDNEEEIYENEEEKMNAFEERGLYEVNEGLGDKNKWKNDDFIKKIDNMMMNDEIIGLSSSEEEEEEDNEQKRIRQEGILKKLEEEYQQRLAEQAENINKYKKVSIKTQNEVMQQKKQEKEKRKREKQLILEQIKQEQAKPLEEKIVEEYEEREIAGEKVFIMPSKEERRQLKDRLIEQTGMNEYLKNKGMTGAIKAHKELEEKESLGLISDYVPTRDEYFGEGRELVGHCDSAPQTFEVHENIYCMKVVKEDIEVKPRKKVEVEKEEFNEEDYEEVEREDVAKRLKRKRKETKEERKKRKEMIKERKRLTKEKRKKFKEKFDTARKDRIKQDNIDKRMGNLKGIAHYKIN